MTPLAAPRLRNAGAMMERNWYVHRRNLLPLVSGFFEPLLYLLSLGVGVGALIRGLPLPDGRVVSYAEFVAPAMLATSAMNGAVTETAYNFFGKMRYARLYDAVLATPVTPVEIAVGELAWAMARGALYSAAFLVTMAAMGLVASGWAVLALPGAVLIGFAFGGLGLAVTTYRRSWQDGDYVGLLTVVMFLFSGTFAPVTAYPAALRVTVELTPLYHGVELIRGLTTGAVTPALLGHAAYLLAVTLLGLAVAARRVARLLLK